MGKIRFGIIGTSGITENFLKGATKVENFKLVGVYSRDMDKAKDFGEKKGARLFFDSLEKMASCEEIDAIYIASPNFMHASQAITCLENGKHVLCEKAFASNSKEVKKMIETANKNNVVLMEAMKTTVNPNFKALMENIHKIGKIRRYFASYCQYSSRYDKYKEGIVLNAFKKELSNGALMDIGIYCIYPMVVLFGKPENIKADAIMLESGVDGQGSILFNYKDMNGVVQYSKIANSYLPCEIQGEEGNIIIDKINGPADINIKYRDGHEENISVFKEADDMCYEIEEFINVINSGEKVSKINSLETSLWVSEIMENARKQIGLEFPADL
ncbi:Gfo/Idh/MocA family protein [Clostridium vincentii]|uniref:1,5-anhydro-D-fructose reductase n=1 Tax=Clostridium vincentii TaxID=52704 RepID=A0A2T0B7C7_9CLOT|nr:Gfo/Idh/MocA family oxidoreductase [Clostridium vincentii]PRR79791.1 1,5-anhydro-D-fructose reductase [Clostridium vincentii]